MPPQVLETQQALRFQRPKTKWTGLGRFHASGTAPTVSYAQDTHGWPHSLYLSPPYELFEKEIGILGTH